MIRITDDSVAYLCCAAVLCCFFIGMGGGFKGDDCDKEHKQEEVTSARD